MSFGTKEGPWNHSVRLERMPNVQFTAIVDPDLELAKVQALYWIYRGPHMSHRVQQGAAGI